MSSTTAFPIPHPVLPPSPKEIGHGVTLLDPQSRRGCGPGLIVVVDDAVRGARIEGGIPSPLMKWAEEGYTVVEIVEGAFGESKNPIATAIEALSRANACTPKDAIGLVYYSPKLWTTLPPLLASGTNIAGAIIYTDAADMPDLSHSDIPLLIHAAGKIETAKAISTHAVKVYAYPDHASHRFATPFHDAFQYAAEAVSHTRNLTFLKPLMAGPYFDLETLWDEHTYWEFEYRSVENTMLTMVQEPYVNHIPTITGGIGRDALTEFYTNHFIFSNPDDATLELISRTVGIDRVVDEMVFKLTHDKVVDWLLPGVPPTGKYIEFALMAIVNIRGDRLYHEHITWDSASVLRQVGLLPEQVAWPVHLKDSVVDGNANSDTVQQLRLPVAGSETVAKMRDKNSVMSNEMFGWGVPKR